MTSSSSPPSAWARPGELAEAARDHQSADRRRLRPGFQQAA